MNHIKFCSCKACKAGKHSPRSKAVTRNKIRGNRHAVKNALRNGQEPAKVISAGRTD